ncbi:MAG: S9 family peptidase [Bacteroidetes bacterium]|nr:S9 family peptidase [Bacteroidota bacterium]
MIRRMLFLWCMVGSVFAQEKRVITYEDFIDLKRVDGGSLSPDGRWVVYNVRTYSLKTNTYVSNLFLQSVDGKTTKMLTSSSFKDFSPVWSPDGKQIAFVSNRGGSYQIFTMALDGGEPRRLSDISTEVSAGNGLAWSPDGKKIAFTSDVYPDCETDECNRTRNAAREESKVKAQVIDKIPFRVWDSWKEGKRSQLFVIDVESGKFNDLIKGDFDVPPIDLGGAMDFAFSPDSKTIVFTMNTEKNIAWSTNNDVWTLPVSGGDLKKISTSLGNDNQPVYSPDGKYIAFRSMKRAGFEADQQNLMLYELSTGKTVNLTEKFDRSVGGVNWSPDSKVIYLDVEDQGYHVIYDMPVTGGTPRKLTDKTYDVILGVSDNSMVTRRTSFSMPPEIFVLNRDGSGARNLSNQNTAKLALLDLPAAEEFWFPGAGGTKVHGFLVKPPKFDEKKSYPAIYLVHGGPQGAWNNGWSWRWNPELFSAPGFVSIMVNPRGSTGYGQKFTDEITKDWGGKVYEDLMKGVDYVVKNYSFIDGDRIGAAGGSYGGYMMNWMNGHTDRFKCMVSHAGIMEKITMYGGTEELWFEEWEMGGPYWEGRNKETFEKWSPHNFVQNFKTPTLVIHGELDYRVPVQQGINLFQVLQRKGIPSKFLYYPDEGHWILKPQNGQLWYKEVHAWFNQWLNKPAN